MIEREFDFEEALAILSPWLEVPQARFLSWSEAEQLAYCAERDWQSAEAEEDVWWKRFYRDRALTYGGAS